MHKKNLVIDKLLRVNNALNCISKKPKNFGTEDLLYNSEIHTITAIKNNPKINLTDLSLYLGVSKSATSKFINKLLSKGYITKDKAIDNKKSVLFTLTEKGTLAANGHEKFSHIVFKDIYISLDNKSKTDIDVISNFLDDIYNTLEKIDL